MAASFLNLNVFFFFFFFTKIAKSYHMSCKMDNPGPLEFSPLQNVLASNDKIISPTE